MRNVLKSSIGDTVVQSSSVPKDAILTSLTDERCVTFEGGEIIFPNVQFTNIQEALDYIKRQENLLMQKNRENNTEAVKELNDFIDLIFKYCLNPDNLVANSYSLEANERVSQKIKDFFENYVWSVSELMMVMAQERKNNLLQYPNDSYRNDGPNGWRLWYKPITRELLEGTEWEDLIQMFKQYAEELPTRIKDEDKVRVNSRLLFIVIKIYQKYTNESLSIHLPNSMF